MWVLRFRRTHRQLQIDCVDHERQSFRYRFFPSSKRLLPDSYYRVQWKVNQEAQMDRFLHSCELIRSHGNKSFTTPWIGQVICRLMARGLQLIRYEEAVHEVSILDCSHLFEFPKQCKDFHIDTAFQDNCWEFNRKTMVKIHVMRGQLIVQLCTHATDCYSLQENDYVIIPPDSSYRIFKVDCKRFDVVLMIIYF